MNKDGKYYAVFTEWLYPAESGRDFLEEYDSEEDALDAARKECENERQNYETVCGDALPPVRYAATANSPAGGYCLTARDGITEWWFAAKVVPVEHGI